MKIALNDYPEAKKILDRMAPADPLRKHFELLLLTLGYNVYGAGDDPFREIPSDAADELLERYPQLVEVSPRVGVTT